MKAIVFTRYGPPSVLSLQELDRPSPANDEVLVRVCATAVNDWDWAYVRGKPRVLRLLTGLRRPKVTVLGAEIAGTVEAVGSRARRFQPGDRVYGDISEAGFGGFAEYVSVKETALCAMPNDLSFEQAAAMPHAAGLAVQGLVDSGGLQHGDNILINGAGGGVGIIAIQIAKEFDAEVTAVDSGPKLDTLRSLGVDHVIDYQREDFTRNGQRYDLILDTKTTRSPLRLLRSLSDGGRYVTVGGQMRRLIQMALLRPLLDRLSEKKIRVVALTPNKGLDYVANLFQSNALECMIDGPYPLSEVPRAIQRFGEAKHVGKIVISVAQP